MIYNRQMKGFHEPSGWALCWAVMFPPSLPSTRCSLLPGVLSSLPRAVTKARICNKCFFLVTVLTCCMCLYSVLCVLFTSGATVILIFLTWSTPASSNVSAVPSVVSVALLSPLVPFASVILPGTPPPPLALLLTLRIASVSSGVLLCSTGGWVRRVGMRSSLARPVFPRPCP